MPSESERRADRRKRQRARATAKNWKINPTAATPYEEWGDVGGAYRSDVQRALAHVGGAVELDYSEGSNRKPSKLTVEDLAVGLFAVDCVGKRGISYPQLQCAFGVAKVGWSRAKSAAIFRTLLGLKVIEHVGNYSTNSHGNCYRIVRNQGNKIAPWD